jgi:hypothetical protein
MTIAQQSKVCKALITQRQARIVSAVLLARDVLGGSDRSGMAFLTCNVPLSCLSGYSGMPSLKIRPKKLSMHGRQVVSDYNGRTLFSVGKVSRIKTMSLRHNLEVCIGDSSDEVPLLRRHALAWSVLRAGHPLDAALATAPRCGADRQLNTCLLPART